MKAKKLFGALVFSMVTLLSGCGGTTSAMEENNNSNLSSIDGVSSDSEENEDSYTGTMTLPDALEDIPEDYLSPATEQGQLEDLYYDTYESFSYDQKETVLHKHAVVYLPYGYSENEKYDVFYLMHGGWSNENTLLGTPSSPSTLKNALDHGIQDGLITKRIVVCPTYNNTSEEDSSDYSLALQLTDNWPQEFIHDLMPAVEGKYSTYAADTTLEGLEASRDHRAFAGFSMGSVTTWHVFEKAIAYVRYFFPSSGAVGQSAQALAESVKEAGYGENDFFLFGASGTDDFAYSAFTSLMNDLKDNDFFTYANNEEEGNLYYLVKEGAQHNASAASRIFYNDFRFSFPKKEPRFTLDSTVEEVENEPLFEGFGSLLFPVDRNVDKDLTLEEVSSSSVYVWYSDIQPERTVEIVNYLYEEAKRGRQIFYPIYTEEEIEADPEKKDTGLFFFRGEKNAPFAITNAGGGFMYVGAMHDSFPHALELSKRGYNAFALIYRPDTAYEDLARAITFIHDNVAELQVDPDTYSLWGGSAGARMAATLGNLQYLRDLTDREDIPQAKAVIMQYTGYSYYDKYDAPTFACVGSSDGIADADTMKERLDNLESLGIPTEFHEYEGLRHGFGLGENTVAEGWLDLAVNFIEAQIS